MRDGQTFGYYVCNELFTTLLRLSNYVWVTKVYVKTPKTGQNICKSMLF